MPDCDHEASNGLNCSLWVRGLGFTYPWGLQDDRPWQHIMHTLQVQHDVWCFAISTEMEVQNCNGPEGW
jgi:hypothetical protein